MKSQKEIEDYLAKLERDYAEGYKKASRLLDEDFDVGFKLLNSLSDLVIIMGTLKWILGIDTELPKVDTDD